MCRSVIVKGMEAIVIESFVTARRYGVEDAVLASLAETFPGLDWETERRLFLQPRHPPRQAAGGGNARSGRDGARGGARADLRERNRRGGSSPWPISPQAARSRACARTIAGAHLPTASGSAAHHDWRRRVNWRLHGAWRPMAEEHSHDDEQSDLGPMDLRVRALETVLTQKGYVDPAALDALIDTYQTKIGPRNGARVVARAWVDPAFRQWLLADATAAIASLGYSGRQGEHMVAVENTPRATTSSCARCAAAIRGRCSAAAAWYKSAPYRARAVKDPRGVLADFGVRLPMRPRSV
jgi:nitrile hydratase